MEIHLGRKRGKERGRGRNGIGGRKVREEKEGEEGMMREQKGSEGRRGEGGWNRLTITISGRMAGRKVSPLHTLPRSHRSLLRLRRRVSRGH